MGRILKRMGITITAAGEKFKIREKKISRSDWIFWLKIQARRDDDETSGRSWRQQLLQ